MTVENAPFASRFLIINYVIDHVIRIPKVFQNVALNSSHESVPECTVGNERAKRGVVSSKHGLSLGTLPNALAIDSACALKADEKFVSFF